MQFCQIQMSAKKCKKIHKKFKNKIKRQVFFCSMNYKFIKFIVKVVEFLVKTKKKNEFTEIYTCVHFPAQQYLSPKNILKFFI